MLAAVLSLLLVYVAVRGIILLARAFMRWLDEGPQLRRLVDEGFLHDSLVESRQAAEIRAFVEECEEWRRESRLVRRSHADRPRLTRRQRRYVRKAEALARERYLATMHLNWFHVVSVFLIASFLGLVIEQLYTYAVYGLTESRVGLVWGPFSPLYGFGAVLLTLICWALRRRSAPWWAIFATGVVVGGVLEQATGWGMETLFHASSWDYTGYPGALSKWVSVPYLFFWGALGLFWEQVIMPDVLYRIGMPSTVRQVVFVAMLALYIASDIFMTVACFGRMAARDQGVPAQTPFQEWIDMHYSDRFIAGRFQNLVVSTKATGREA
ncbi:MAG: putative ABC transporter permease [Acidobacteriota bacterium]|nr:putative ABC transporter permease [Acidobacteriota bacterium]